MESGHAHRGMFQLSRVLKDVEHPPGYTTVPGRQIVLMMNMCGIIHVCYILLTFLFARQYTNSKLNQPSLLLYFYLFYRSRILS